MSGGFERFTIEGACNEPVPYNWKNACRRRSGHPGLHHYWDPRTGSDRARHPYPFRDAEGREIPVVIAWGPGVSLHDVRMLTSSAYVAPRRTDREMVAATKAREIR